MGIVKQITRSYEAKEVATLENFHVALAVLSRVTPDEDKSSDNTPSNSDTESTPEPETSDGTTTSTCSTSATQSQKTQQEAKVAAIFKNLPLKEQYTAKADAVESQQAKLSTLLDCCNKIKEAAKNDTDIDRFALTLQVLMSQLDLQPPRGLTGNIIEYYSAVTKST